MNPTSEKVSDCCGADYYLRNNGITGERNISTCYKCEKRCNAVSPAKDPECNRCGLLKTIVDKTGAKCQIFHASDGSYYIHNFSPAKDITTLSNAGEGHIDLAERPIIAEQVINDYIASEVSRRILEIPKKETKPIGEKIEKMVNHLGQDQSNYMIIEKMNEIIERLND
jgi:hypothetical protein